ncbi:hypothetical protein [Pleurocapsa sp. PCC 7319]|uniref:hypothetical protein n=1 Tax=Pleurocapsa sp. PCC 7319 TaxID=118161 RepID=UPI00034DD693|nr:hypothetical protein [Pleurocapsa sp. PCC 7319]
MSNYNLLNKVPALILALTATFITAQYSNLQAQETDSNTTIEDIAEEKDTTLGEEVSVRGEVEEVEPGVSFLIEEEGFLEGDEVLVINVSEKTVLEDAEGQTLQVIGELGTLVLADVERDYGLDLDPELYVDYETKPVIFADYMVVSPELEEVSENPDSYYDQEISLEGEVGEIKNDYAFTLKEDQLIGGENLLIINATGEPIPEVDEKVVVTGMVRPFIKADFEKDYDLTWDLDVQEEIEAEYTEKPVLVVDSIYSAAEDQGFLE